MGRSHVRSVYLETHLSMLVQGDGKGCAERDKLPVLNRGTCGSVPRSETAPGSVITRGHEGQLR